MFISYPSIAGNIKFQEALRSDSRRLRVQNVLICSIPHLELCALYVQAKEINGGVVQGEQEAAERDSLSTSAT